MSLSEATLKKLSKDEVINLLLDYQNKFETTLTRLNTDLSGLRQDLSDLKQNYIKLESELSVARQVDNKLKEHIVSLEHQCWNNSQYPRRECLEITGIPDKTDQKDLENTALKIFRKLDVEINSSNCHWLPRKGPKREIIKFSKRKDAKRIRYCKKNLKGMDLTSLGIFSPVSIDDSLCQYYNMLWRKCKKLLTNKFVDSFWASNGC